MTNALMSKDGDVWFRGVQPTSQPIQRDSHALIHIVYQRRRAGIIDELDTVDDGRLDDNVS